MHRRSFLIAAAAAFAAMLGASRLEPKPPTR